MDTFGMSEDFDMDGLDGKLLVHQLNSTKYSYCKYKL